MFPPHPVRAQISDLNENSQDQALERLPSCPVGKGKASSRPFPLFPPSLFFPAKGHRSEMGTHTVLSPSWENSAGDWVFSSLVEAELEASCNNSSIC